MSAAEPQDSSTAVTGRVRPLAGALLALVGGLVGCRSAVVERAEPDAPVWTAADCPESEAMPPVRCGSVRVFEDRDAGAGRTLDLYTVVLAATTDAPAPDPLFILFGGPGQGATDFALDVAPAFEGTRRRRDVVFVDQRGTGASNPLDCRLPSEPQAAFGAVFPRDVIARCRTELEQRAELGLYTTDHFARDLDDVRRALGYDRINLSGGSYGTRAALVYARRYPEHSRTLILDGVFPVTIPAALPYAETADQSLRRILSDCAADEACRGAYPDLEARFDRLVAGWEGTKTVEIEVGDDESTTPSVIELSLGDFGYGIRGLQYGPGAWKLPGELYRAASEGDLKPIAQAYYGRAVAIWDAISIGHHLSVFCAEDLPFVREDEVTPRTERTYLGRYLFDEYAEACALWVQGEITDDYRQPTTGEVPALLFSGARDPITPPWTAEKAAESLPNALHVVFRFGGHGYTGGDDGGCKSRLIARFLDTASVTALDTSCVDEVKPGGFVLPEPAG